jgi:hypothetical protein
VREPSAWPCGTIGLAASNSLAADAVDEQGEAFGCPSADRQKLRAPPDSPQERPPLPSGEAQARTLRALTRDPP